MAAVAAEADLEVVAEAADLVEVAAEAASEDIVAVASADRTDPHIITTIITDFSSGREEDTMATATAADASAVCSV